MTLRSLVSTSEPWANSLQDSTNKPQSLALGLSAWVGDSSEVSVLLDVQSDDERADERDGQHRNPQVSFFLTARDAVED